MRKFGENRIIPLTAIFFSAFVLTSANYYRLAVHLPEAAVQAAADRSDLKISAGESQGTIYDRNMKPLTNSKKKYIAVAVPSLLDIDEWAATARDRGIRVIIAAAGKAAHLGGVVAAFTPCPVIAVPMKTSDLGGLDSLLSMVQMPSGVPVACVAINGAKNAAILAVQMLGTGDDEALQKIVDFKQAMAEA